MNIGPRVIKKTVSMFECHLNDYKSDIEEAYCKADNALDVTLKAKYSPNESGVKIESTITFVAEKIKDSMKATVDEQQRELFDESEKKAPVIPIRPKKVSGRTAGEWCRLRSRNGLK